MDNAIIKMLQHGYNLTDLYIKSDIGQAKEVLDVMDTMDINQLTGNQFKKFYVNTDEIRGKNITSILARNFKRKMAGNKKLLFSGFTGSGKTTELIHLSYQLEDDFNIIIFSIMNRLKVTNITIESFLFELAGDILSLFVYKGLEHNEKLTTIIEELTLWCSNTEIIQIKESKEHMEGGIGLNFLKGIFLKAKIEGSHTGTEQKKIKRIDEPKLHDLIFLINKLFMLLSEETGKDTLVIVDDFEKLPFLKARDFYTQNAMFINNLFCKMILTIPIELVYHSDFSLIQGTFDEAEIIPMIKVKDCEGKPYEKGIKLLEDILRQRVDLSLFENNCYKQAITYSGGSLRELFKLIYDAVSMEDSNIITEESMKKAILNYKDTFSSRIQERIDEPKISFNEYLEALFDIYEGNRKNPERTKALLDLLRTRGVMKYNGEGFYATHPLLEDFIKSYYNKRNKK